MGFITHCTYECVLHSVKLSECMYSTAQLYYTILYYTIHSGSGWPWLLIVSCKCVVEKALAVACHEQCCATSAKVVVPSGSASAKAPSLFCSTLFVGFFSCRWRPEKCQKYGLQHYMCIPLYIGWWWVDGGWHCTAKPQGCQSPCWDGAVALMEA